MEKLLSTTTQPGAKVKSYLGQDLPALSKLSISSSSTAATTSTTTTTTTTPKPHPLLLISPPACLRHDIPGHFERPQRITSILDSLHQHRNDLGLLIKADTGGDGGGSSDEKAIQKEAHTDTDANDKYVIRDVPLATREQLRLFHTPAHVEKLFSLFEETEAAQAAVDAAAAAAAATTTTATTSTKNNNNKNKNATTNKKTIIKHIDSDTSVMPASGEAALRAVGAACMAVDEVLTGKAESAFCVIRPPGHHATPERAMGFCLFNNAGIAALWARKTYGLKRVAVIDPDVHHGNGVQDGFFNDPDLFYASTHQGYGQYPGTGFPHETGIDNNIVNCPLHEDEGSIEFRHAYTHTILPALKAFKPELIIMSMGFDAHEDDPLGELELVPEDFWWVTKRLVEVGQECVHTNEKASGMCVRVCKVISLLEGGYDLAALGACGVAHVRGLLGLPFTEVGEEEEEEEVVVGGGGVGVSVGGVKEGHHLLKAVTEEEEGELVERMEKEFSLKEGKGEKEKGT